MENNTGWFAIKGDVVDEEGKPLNEVTLHVLRHKTLGLSILSPHESNTQIKEQTINGVFDVKVCGAYEVSIAFQKEGYRCEQILLQKKDVRVDREHLSRYTQQPDGRVRIVLKKSVFGAGKPRCGITVNGSCDGNCDKFE